MKTIKLLFIFMVLSAAAFYSCSDNDPIQYSPPVAQESIALRTALNEIKIHNDIAGRPAESGKKSERLSPFCFDLVYPITLSMNNGTTLTVNNFAGLIDILLNESPAIYVSGIVFPFQVIQSGSVLTIGSESDLTALLQSCGFATFNDDLLNTFCLEIVFPIQIGSGGQVIIIDSLTELQEYISGAGNNGVPIIFPISVIYNNQIVTVNNLYEFYQMVNNCDVCICTLEYAPVCVQTAVGLVEYSNMCFAMCAGYDQSDLVPCNPSDCDISNVQVTVGGCDANNSSYELTVNFTYSNPDASTFTIHNSANVLMGTFNLSALPLTIPDYPNNLANATDFLTVSIGSNCSDSVQWTLPNCGCPCPANVDPVCVWNGTELVTFQNSCLAECAGYSPNDFVTCGVAPSNFGTQLGDCFTIQYPVYVQYQGALVEVNSNGQLLQYWFPATGPIPAMVYPITVTFGSSTFIMTSQPGFEAAIANWCD